MKKSIKVFKKVLISAIMFELAGGGLTSSTLHAADIPDPVIDYKIKTEDLKQPEKESPPIIKYKQNSVRQEPNEYIFSPFFLCCIDFVGGYGNNGLVAMNAHYIDDDDIEDSYFDDDPYDIDLENIDPKALQNLTQNSMKKERKRKKVQGKKTTYSPRAAARKTCALVFTQQKK